MVAGSLALRARLDRQAVESATPLRLVCAAHLGPVCDDLAGSQSGLDVVIEPAGATADRLMGAADAGIDGWLVSAAWPELVDAARRSRALPALFAPDRPVLARSPLVLAVWKVRNAVLSAHCGRPTDWRCLGEAAAAGSWQALGGPPEWGRLRPGHAEPASDDVGLLVLGQAVSEWFGRTDVAAIDLDDDAFRRWFAALERAVPPSAGSPLGFMLAAGPAAFDAVGTTEAEAGPVLARAARGGEVDLLYPLPMATADVVLAAAAGAPGGMRLASAVGGRDGRKALADAGWRVEGEPRAPGVSAVVDLPPSSNLPTPGLLEALRQRWREVVR